MENIEFELLITDDMKPIPSNISVNVIKENYSLFPETGSVIIGDQSRIKSTPENIVTWLAGKTIWYHQGRDFWATRVVVSQVEGE